MFCAAGQAASIAVRLALAGRRQGLLHQRQDVQGQVGLGGGQAVQAGRQRGEFGGRLRFRAEYQVVGAAMQGPAPACAASAPSCPCGRSRYRPETAPRSRRTRPVFPLSAPAPRGGTAAAGRSRCLQRRRIPRGSASFPPSLSPPACVRPALLWAAGAFPSMFLPIERIISPRSGEIAKAPSLRFTKSFHFAALPMAARKAWSYSKGNTSCKK